MEQLGRSTETAALRVVGSCTRASGATTPHDELLRIDHGEGEAIQLADLRLVRERAGVRTELWRFPDLIDQELWQIDPGETVVISSGRGADTYYARTDARPTFWLYVQGDTFLWEPGDRCWIEDGDGRRLSNELAL